jgi:hypothetical protein
MWGRSLRERCRVVNRYSTVRVQRSFLLARFEVVFGRGTAADDAMFLLGHSEFSKDVPSLVSAIGDGLRPLGLDSRAVFIDGALPALAVLRCDLSGAVFRPEHRPAFAVDGLAPAFFSRRAEVLFRPAFFGDWQFTGALGMDDAVFGFGRDAAGNAVLALALERCGAGTLELSVARSEVEKAVFSLAAKAAEEQGAEVKAVSVAWESVGPRALGLKIVARAKAMFVETGITATGRVEITDSLSLRVSALECSGDGMMGNLAATFLRKEIPKYEGRSISLAGAFGGLRLNDVSLACDASSMRVKATLGAA